MSVIDLRAARETDAGRLGAILSAWVDETPWMPRLHTRAEDIGFVGTMISRGWVTLAEADGRPVGFVAREEGFIHALYIAGEMRRSGCGRALLQAMQRRVPKLSLWTFVANEEAQAFYGAMGFTEVERTEGQGNDEGLPDIRYHWAREARA